MIDRSRGSKTDEQRESIGVSAPAIYLQKLSTEQELAVVEEALVLQNPTPEDDEAFREYLRKNGIGGGDP